MKKIDDIIKQKFGPNATFTIDTRHFHENRYIYLVTVSVDTKGTVTVVPAAVISTKIARGVVWQVYECTYQTLDPK